MPDSREYNGSLEQPRAIGFSRKRDIRINAPEDSRPWVILSRLLESGQCFNEPSVSTN
jgi:hypothetical protein